MVWILAALSALGPLSAAPSEEKRADRDVWSRISGMANAKSQFEVSGRLEGLVNVNIVYDHCGNRKAGLECYRLISKFAANDEPNARLDVHFYSGAESRCLVRCEIRR